MASVAKRPGDRHKRDPIGYRVPADIWPLLEARMQETGRGASVIITAALRAYLSAEQPETGT